MTAHTIAITPARVAVPEVLVARCSCGWAGPVRTGRNARALARADGQAHLEREQARPRN
jgi:hypothetical protein